MREFCFVRHVFRTSFSVAELAAYFSKLHQTPGGVGFLLPWFSYGESDSSKFYLRFVDSESGSWLIRRWNMLSCACKRFSCSFRPTWVPNKSSSHALSSVMLRCVRCFLLVARLFSTPPLYFISDDVLRRWRSTACDESLADDDEGGQKRAQPAGGDCDRAGSALRGMRKRGARRRRYDGGVAPTLGNVLVAGSALSAAVRSRSSRRRRIEANGPVLRSAERRRSGSSGRSQKCRATSPGRQDQLLRRPYAFVGPGRDRGQPADWPRGVGRSCAKVGSQVRDGELAAAASSRFHDITLLISASTLRVICVKRYCVDCAIYYLNFSARPHQRHRRTGLVCRKKRQQCSLRWIAVGESAARLKCPQEMARFRESSQQSSPSQRRGT